MARGDVIRPNILKELFIWLPLVLPLLFYFVWKSDLPKTIPSHYDLNGEPNAVMPPLNLVLFLMAAGFFVNALMMLAPFVDVKRSVDIYTSRLYIFIRFFLTSLLSGIAIMSMLQGLGYEFPLTRLILAAIFLLFGGMGWMMRSLQSNGVVGIRLPWTLGNERIWKRTHRLSGILLSLCATSSLALVFVLPSQWEIVLFSGTIVIGLLYPALQSYFWYRSMK